eukprot:TRINITY_DN11894_c0_g1_i1.p1 TRINITY_DN11894_c0_g1~~TRINITY_DN11894_c0_g1_i1.p1  ORF type:complete len:413 (-),score=20.58 TRINITY_DN11894_c0_g1_i1:17-1255(-)
MYTVVPRDDLDLTGSPLQRINQKPNKRWKEIRIFFLMFLCIASGGLNRVAGKIMTIPMGNFSFFLSLLNGVMYTITYWAILYFRVQIGAVPYDQLKFPYKRRIQSRSLNFQIQSQGSISKISSWMRFWNNLPPFKYFVLMGAMDGLGNIISLIAQPNVSGPMTILMNQTIILFSMIVSMILLNARYNYWQVWSCFTVIMGALVSLTNTLAGHGTGQSKLFFCILMAGSNIPSAISFALKEKIFKMQPDLDVFVVNSLASTFQLVLWPVFVPITLLFDQTHGLPLLKYVEYGFKCFVGGVLPELPGNGNQDCSPNPWPYFVYISINLFFNITLLVLLKSSSSLLAFLALTALLPVSVILFYFNWPLLGTTTIDSYAFIGLVMILVALVVYRLASVVKENFPDDSTCCSRWLPC